MSDKKRSTPPAKQPARALEQRATPLWSDWLSFRYSFRGLASDGERAHLVARERRYENGKLETEDFEGTLEGPAAIRLIEQASRAAHQLVSETARATIEAFAGAGRLIQGALELQRLMTSPLLSWRPVGARRGRDRQNPDKPRGQNR